MTSEVVMMKFDIKWKNGNVAVHEPISALWGEFSIFSGEKWITRNKMRKPPGEVSDAVSGSLFGLLDWLSDNWLRAFYEIKTRFPSSRKEGFIPPVANAELDDETHCSLFYDWLGAHLWGCNCSDLAIPNIVFLPDIDHIDLLISPLPFRLNPSVEFVDEKNVGIRPFAVSLRREECLQVFRKFSTDCIKEIKKCLPQSSLADHYQSRFAEICRIEADNEKMPQYALGEELYESFRRMLMQNAMEQRTLYAFFLDSDPDTVLSDISMLTELVGNCRQPAKKSVKAFDMFRKYNLKSPLRYEQGYEMARHYRRESGNIDRPIEDLENMIEKSGVGLMQDLDIGFRSAGARNWPGKPMIITSAREERNKTFEGKRFAVASALGRMLFEEISDPDCTAGIHVIGDYCRYAPMARASAFAAELILPSEVFSRESRYWSLDDIKILAGDYGISVSAACWHAYNSGAQLEPDANPR